MKKILFLFLATVLVFVFSCQKKEAVNLPQQQSLVFSVNHVNPDVGLKATLPCIDEDPNYAWVNINGQNYYPDVYQLDGKWYTQAIKLDVNPPTSFTVNKFSLWHLTGANKPTGTQTPITNNDDLVMATPNTGAEYSEYVTKPTPFTIPVTAFEKAQVPVEVLCFQAADYSNFGFDWFVIKQIVIREQCFFGDICLNGDPFSPADFNGSLYGNDVGVDVPAIMKVVVKKNGVEVLNSPFDNESYQGTGSPLCVQYPDDLGVTGEVYTFELYLRLKNDAGWSYQLYYIYTSTDDGALMLDDNTTPADTDGNGVVEFVVGTCNYSDTDQNLLWLCPPDFYQGFETDYDGWFDYPGPISLDGSGHAIVENGAFTKFDGFLSVWPGTWTAEIDVYLDPAWADGLGFDYSVAAQGTDGAHRRDFIWHVGQVASTGLLVNANNNSDGTVNSYVLLNDNDGNYYTIATAGWYTLQQVFYNNAGVLAVDFNLLDNGGNLLWSVTRSDASDLIPSVVGGNRYGWFVFINVPGGILIDETKLRRNCNL